MRELLRILQPSRHQWRWMLAGIGLGVAVIAANTALMAVSGWFIASMAVAGVAKVSFNFVFPLSRHPLAGDPAYRWSLC